MGRCVRIVLSSIFILLGLFTIVMTLILFEGEALDDILMLILGSFYLLFGIWAMRSTRQVVRAADPHVNEHEGVISSSGLSLAGTMCLPADSRVSGLCLFVHGSGPLDRDENMRGQHLDIFNTIAHHLAHQGIGSLRYDKRGCGDSTGDFYRAGHSDIVNDAAACLEYLIHELDGDLRRVFVIGHSEGTIIAPQLAARYPGIGGIVLLCPFIDGVESILMKQAAHFGEAAKDLGGVTGIILRTVFWLGGGSVAMQRKLIARIKASKAPYFRYRWQKIPARILRDLMELDPAALFREVRCPVLIIGGEKDVQCEPGDVAKIAATVQGEVEPHVVPDLTHVLRADDGPASIFRYVKLIKQPLDDRVLGLVSEWVLRKSGVRVG